MARKAIATTKSRESDRPTPCSVQASAVAVNAARPAARYRVTIPRDEGRGLPRSLLQLADLPGLDYVDEDVPFIPLETDDVALLANADDIAVDGNFRARRAGWAERDLIHGSRPYRIGQGQVRLRPLSSNRTCER